MMIFTQMSCNYKFVALEADSSANVMVKETVPLLAKTSSIDS